MLEALARGKAQRVRGVAFFVVVTTVLSLGGLAAAAANISVESLQIGLVEGSVAIDRASLGLDKGIIGDTVRVSALVGNDGTSAVGEFEVDFFFTETISGEHGRLGTQVVSGLEPGETKRPVIAFDTTSFSPGLYAFSAKADPRDALGDSNLCDNVAPREACSGTSAESTSKYSLTLLRQGSHISRAHAERPLPTVSHGRLQTSLTVSVWNVGTETLSGSDLAVYGYYRLGLTAPANEFKALVTDASGNPVQLSKIAFLGKPGESGSFLTLNYDVLTKLAPSRARRRRSTRASGFCADPYHGPAIRRKRDGTGPLPPGAVRALAVLLNRRSLDLPRSPGLLLERLRRVTSVSRRAGGRRRPRVPCRA